MNVSPATLNSGVNTAAIMAEGVKLPHGLCLDKSRVSPLLFVFQPILKGHSLCAGFELILKGKTQNLNSYIRKTHTASHLLHVL